MCNNITYGSVADNSFKMLTAVSLALTLYISSLESGVRITTDCLITCFYTDAFESTSKFTQFDEDINLAMVLRVSV